MTDVSVDLLEELRAAVDALAPRLAGRAVDIEMPRVRVLVDPVEFRRDFTALVESAIAGGEPTESIVVHVARRGKVARIQVAGAADALTVPLPPGGSGAADA